MTAAVSDWNPQEHPRRPAGQHGGGQFFHGSSRVHQPGAIIDPAQPHTKQMRGSADDRFYVTDSVKTAKTYADMASGNNPILGKRPGMSGEPHVYEVQPLGQLEPDYRPGTYRTPHKVRVVRELKPEEIAQHTAGNPVSRSHGAYVERTRALCSVVGLELAR